LFVQAYELFSKGNTLLEVAIKLNIGQIQATQYYTEYLKLVQLDDITKIYVEFKGDASYFVQLCKEAKAAKMGASQVVNLLRIVNNQLPSVQGRYEQLQKHINQLESILNTKSKEVQYLNNQVIDTNKNLDTIRLEYRREEALLQGLQQHMARLEGFMYISNS
jgi:chromosome segregation ATPase